MENKYVALNTDRLIKRLVQISECYSKEHNAGKIDGVPKKHLEQLQRTPLRPMGRELAFQWLFCMVEQLVQSRLMYLKPNDDLNKARALFADPSISLTGTFKFFTEDFDKVDEISDMIVDLHNFLDQHIPYNCWIQWNVISVNSTIALISERDYRIIEWEEIKGYRQQGGHLAELDLNPAINYLRHKVNAAFGEITVPVTKPGGEVIQMKTKAGMVLEFGPILLDCLVRLYPRLTFPDQVCLPAEVKDTFQPVFVNEQRLELLGIHDYIGFREKIISPVLEAFGAVHLTRRLDDTDMYVGYLNNQNILVIDYADATQWTRAKDGNGELEALAESYIAGDYLPEADRRRAEAYIMERGRFS